MAREGARLLIGYFDEPGGRTAAIEGAAERLPTICVSISPTSHVSRLTCLSSSSSIPAPQPACSARRVLPPGNLAVPMRFALASGAMNELLRCYAVGECEALLTA